MSDADATKKAKDPRKHFEKIFGFDVLEGTMEDAEAKVDAMSERELIKLVRDKGVEEAYAQFSKPDVVVTNAKDKATMLEALREVDDHVKRVFNRHRHR